MGDKELIYRCRNGDKAAFQELISKYHPYVFKFLLKLRKMSSWQRTWHKRFL